MILRQSGIPYELVDLPTADPGKVVELTRGEHYQVPLLEDIFSHGLVWDQGNDEVARYIDSLAPLMKLFPEEVAGEQRILITYIENECESVGFKVCDAFRDRWLKSDRERGLHRRHKERKFGVGCLEDWTRDVNKLIEAFYRAIYPFEQILSKRAFLTGDRPVFADYALCGVIGNFLFAGTTSLPENCLMLESWYTRMRSGNLRSELEEMHLGEHGEGASYVAAPEEVSDVEKPVADLKLRPGTAALDVGGQVAVSLAGKGFAVTACDPSADRLQEVTRLAAERQVQVATQLHAPEQLPYADGSVGLVTCRMMGHEMAAPESFVREAARILRTYGYLVVVDQTVPDDHAEANAWMNALEKLHDARHVRFITPSVWRKWCLDAGLTVTRVQVDSVRQPELNAYFAQGGTNADDRKKILEMLAKAPAAVREIFKIGQEDGKIVWWQRRVTVVAGKI